MRSIACPLTPEILILTMDASALIYSDQRTVHLPQAYSASASAKPPFHTYGAQALLTNSLISWASAAVDPTSYPRRWSIGHNLFEIASASEAVGAAEAKPTKATVTARIALVSFILKIVLILT